MATKQFDITGGPSREELFDALRLRHEERKVTLTINIPWTLPLSVQVDSIGIEDGSGNNWLLRLFDSKASLFGATHLEAYFNTVTRDGCLTILV